MGKRSKATAQVEKRSSAGEHGGNRGGHRKREATRPKRSSQSAGKQPQRRKGRD